MDLFVNKKDKGKSLSNSVNVTSHLDSISSMNPNVVNSSAQPNNNRKLYHSTSVNYGYGFDSSTTRHRTKPSHSRQNSFLHSSINSSLDFPAYIPWQTLSSEVSENLKSGALRINKSNCLEWASPIKEDIDEKAILLNHEYTFDSDLDDKRCTSATNGGISWQVASFLLVNCALGAGILNYPAAYDKVGGIAIATVFQLVLMVVLGLTMIILVYSSDLNNDNTYHDVILSMCGKRMQQLAAISILMTCYGICVTFLIIIGDQMEKVSFSLQLDESLWYYDRKLVITVLSVIFILPLCYFKRLDFLKYVGALGVFSMFYVVFINIYEYFYLNCDSEMKVELRTRPESFKSMIAVVPVICFAYQTHEVVVPVYASMKTRTVRNFTKTTILTLAILFILYSTAGTFSYLTFGVNVSSDIMMMYDARQPIVLFGTCALVIKMITTYPSILFCGRNAFDGLYAEFFKIDTDQFIKGEKRRRLITTTGWFFTTLVLAVYTPNIGVVIELLGSLASMNVFIFPSICLIVIVNRMNEKVSKFTKAVLYSFSIFLILFGAIIFVLVISEVYVELTDTTSSMILYNATMCKHL